jgi:hypothetical protein
MHGLIIQLPARIIVDPNSVSRRHPDLTAAAFDDADRIPQVGEFVFAVQPDPDGADYLGSAHVEFVDTNHQLVYLRVDWASFSENRPSVVRSDYNVQGQVVHAQVEAALTANPLAEPYELNGSFNQLLAARR